MKLAAAATALAGALLSMSSPPAVAVRTSAATPSMGAPRRRHLQTPMPAAADDDDVPQAEAQLTQVCPPDSRACPGTYFAVLRNPAQRCAFYPCPAPPPAAAAVDAEQASTTSAATIETEEKVTSTDSQDATDQLLADMATLGALANTEEEEEEAPQGSEGGPAAAAASDVEVLAGEQGDGETLPTYELPAPPVATVDGAGGNPNGLADELAAFDEALSAGTSTAAAAAPTTAANCTPCTNTPTQNMLQRSYDCTTAIQALAVQCHEDEGWTAGQICEYSCYKAGRGYARTDVAQGGTRCCEVGEVPRPEVVGEEVEVEHTPTVVTTPEGVEGVGGVDPAEVAREEGDGDGEDGDGDEGPPTGEAEADPAGSTESAAGAVGTNTVDTNEGEDETAADPDASTAGVNAEVEVEVEVEDDEGEGYKEKGPEREVEIISESIAVVDTAPDTTEDDDEEEDGATTADEEGESTAEGDEAAAATTENETTAQDEGTAEGGQEDGASPPTIESTEPATAEEEVESAAATPPPEEATTVTAEEVLSEEGDDMDEAMDQPTSNVEDVPTEQTAVDEPTSPSTAEDESTTAGEMTTPGADTNFDETTDPMCGVDAGDALCPFAGDGTAVYCCSKWGYCGQGVEWCGDGCQEGYGLCGSGSGSSVETESESEGDAEDGDATDMDMTGDADEESTAMDEMMPTDSTELTNDDVEDESTGTAEEVTEEFIMPEEPTDMEDPTDAMEEPTDAMEESIAEEPIAEEPPMDETSDIEDAEGDMDEAAATTSEDPIAEVEDLIPGDAVTEISREEGGTTTETSMDDVEDEEATGLRGSSVAAVQTATSSAAGFKVVASIMIAGASTVVFGMM